jgi:hypothetical protein
VKKVLLLAFVFAQLYGCAAGLKPYPDGDGLFPDEQSLWEIRINRGGSQLFAGLLVLDRKGQSLEAVLLDGTGIKLLAERVLASGEVENVSVSPAVRNKRLAPLLGDGLHRMIFSFGEEGGSACYRDGLFEYCFGAESESHLVKFKRLGPFVLWSVDYFINKYDSTIAVDNARLDSNWPVPSLILKRSGGASE